MSAWKFLDNIENNMELEILRHDNEEEAGKEFNKEHQDMFVVN